MKNIEKQIVLKTQEKKELQRDISKLEYKIKDIEKEQNKSTIKISNLNRTITNLLKSIDKVQNNYKEGFFSKLIKVISLGFIDNQKRKETKVLLIKKKSYIIKKEIENLKTIINELKNNQLINTKEKQRKIELVNQTVNQISILEKEFEVILFKFRDDLKKLLNELITYSSERYINHYSKEKFELKLDSILTSRAEYFQHPKIKSNLLELIAFKNNPKSWVQKKNIQFIKTSKIKDKNFFDTIESKPLTNKQTDAVLVNEINNLVLAGAGSGKTSVVVAKVCYLIKEGIVSPNEILILAFNKKAQEELSERFEKRILRLK